MTLTQLIAAAMVSVFHGGTKARLFMMDGDRVWGWLMIEGGETVFRGYTIDHWRAVKRYARGLSRGMGGRAEAPRQIPFSPDMAAGLVLLPDGALGDPIMETPMRVAHPLYTASHVTFDIATAGSAARRRDAFSRERH